jgi:hypothetical protein
MAWLSSTRCCDPSEAAIGINSLDERHDPRTPGAGGIDQRGDVPNSRRVSSPRPQIRDSTRHGNDRGPRPTYQVRGPVPVCDLASVPCALVSGVRAACRVRAQSTVGSGDARWRTIPEDLLIVVVRAKPAHVGADGAVVPDLPERVGTDRNVLSGQRVGVARR